MRRLAMIGAAIAASSLIAAHSRARTVLIDVGHSLAAPGSTAASGTTEFAYNRALALEIADDMRRLGWTVVMPNADGRVDSLGDRPASAAAAHADLFLSIHHDSIQSWQMADRQAFRGYSVWYSGSHVRTAASRTCAVSIGRAMRGGGMTPNLAHAARVPGEGRDLVDGSIGLYRRDDLAVLRLSKTPAVLVESGVIVNPDEEAWLSRPDVRAGIARTIAAGADACVR